MRVWLLVLFFCGWAVTARALVLEADTVWRGELVLDGPVTVPAGVTLRVEPGSRVRFVRGGLTVSGRILARGARFSGEGWTGLVLKGLESDSRLSDCRLSGATTAVTVESGSPRLEGLELRANRIGIELRRKSAATVRGCLFADNSRVGLMVKDGSTAAVVDNRFEHNGRFGAYIFRARPRRFSGNRFRGQPTGLMISHFGSDPLLEDNRLSGNEVGILVDRAARPVLRGNVIRDNGIGIRCYRRSDPRIEGNRIGGNRIGVLIAYSSYPVLRGNDLAGNGVALRLEYQSIAWERAKGSAARRQQVSRGAFGSRPARQVDENDRRARNRDGWIDARDNWWGEAETRQLEQLGSNGNPLFIDDGRDRPTFTEGGRDWPLDRVRFAPWARQAPAIP